MRTTVSVDEQLLAAARQEARRRGLTLGQLIEDALRRELSTDTARQPIPLPVFRGGTGVRPGIDLRSNRALAELLDD
ncbi:MAG TPA: ribbon-helix-helix protein, CopG family [Pseudonocardiaceae bacterium]|jgi:hypothetical protein